MSCIAANIKASIFTQIFLFKSPDFVQLWQWISLFFYIFLAVSYLLSRTQRTWLPSGNFELFCHFRCWAPARHDWSIELFGTSPFLGPNCQWKSEISHFLDPVTTTPTPPNPLLSNPYSILKMDIYMPHTMESKQAHLKVHMLMCDI